MVCLVRVRFQGVVTSWYCAGEYSVALRVAPMSRSCNDNIGSKKKGKTRIWVRKMRFRGPITVKDKSRAAPRVVFIYSFLLVYLSFLYLYICFLDSRRAYVLSLSTVEEENARKCGPATSDREKVDWLNKRNKGAIVTEKPSIQCSHIKWRWVFVRKRLKYGLSSVKKKKEARFDKNAEGLVGGGIYAVINGDYRLR